MIEIEFPFSIYKNKLGALITFSELMVWFTKYIANDEALAQLAFDGFVATAHDDSFSAYLLSDIDSQQRLLEVLKQPPGIFKEKYVAKIIDNEPIIDDSESMETDSEKDEEEKKEAT